MNKYGMIIEEKRVHFAIIEAENEDSAMEKAAELDVSDYIRSDIDGKWQVEYMRKFSPQTPDDLITKQIIG
jgi:hypothetical protein